MTEILFAILGYLAGSIPFGLLLTRAAGLGDVRKIGSGNIGATNVLRTGNKKIAALTLLCDALKGLLPVLAAKYFGGPWAEIAAGFGALAGHIFPVWLGFKGGKGVATGVGVLSGWSWILGLVFIVGWLLTFFAIRISSVSALTAVLLVVLAASSSVADTSMRLVWPAAALAAIIWITHRANIQRILKGQEPKSSFSSKKMSGPRQLDDAERVSWLQLSRTERIGPITFANLLRRYGTATKALAELPKLAKAGGGRRFKLHPRSAAEDEITKAERLGAAFVVAGEPGYPPYLQHIADAPPLLCIRGHREVAARDAVAIVGARNASANGMRFTRVLAKQISDAGFTIVSGLARGIDTAAHEASVGTATIAVMAGGIDHIYPPENEKLHHEIAAKGLIVSEMPPGHVPRAEHFPRRNRIISGIAKAVIVVEAAMRSGSLITARLAGEQGRDVFAVPGSPLDPRCEGTNRLIRDGAQIVTSIDDVLDALQAPIASQVSALRDPSPPEAVGDIGDGERRRVLTFLSHTETDIDDIIRECGLPPEQVAAVLLELEIAGRVTRGRGGRIALAGN